jgi:transglutaminase-like putative cysteine protease
VSLADKIMRKLYGGAARSGGVGYAGLARAGVGAMTQEGVHAGIICGLQGPGDIECEFGSGPKAAQWPVVMRLARESYGASLQTSGSEAAELNARAYAEMTPEILARAGKFSGLAQKLAAIRDVLRAHVNYVNDPIGKDSVRQIGALYKRGYGDCVSLTIAMSALAQRIYGLPSRWILGGDSSDEARHIWPAISGVVADAADPMPPLGQAHPMPKTRTIGP